MDELDDAVIGEAHREGEKLLVSDFVAVIERHHDVDGPGVPRDLVDEYFDELEAEDEFNVGAFREQFEAHLTSERSFVDEDAVYEMGDGRVSAYPVEWHEQFHESGSLADLVDAMTSSMSETARSAVSKGVPKDKLLNAATAMGDMERAEARDQLKDLRADGVLVADTDQHPRADILLAEDAEMDKDELDKPDWRHGSNE